jgi:hypothetical protein
MREQLRTRPAVVIRSAAPANHSWSAGMAEDREGRAAGRARKAIPEKPPGSSPDSADVGDTPGDRASSGRGDPGSAGGTEQPKNDRRKRGDLQKRL